MIAYFDTSALIKLINVTEEHASLVAEVWDSTDCIAATSRFTYPEGRSAMARAKREGVLTKGEFTQVRTAWERILEQVNIIEVDSGVAATAGDMSDTYALRAGDAVQLASALQFLPQAITFVCSDDDLVSAAVREGLTVLPKT